MMTRKRKNPAAVTLGKRSAAGRMEKLTPEQRKVIAAHAAAVRWGQPQIEGQSVTQTLERLGELRLEIIKRRKANGEKRKTWDPAQIGKAEQSQLLDYIEFNLDKLSTGLILRTKPKP